MSLTDVLVFPACAGMIPVVSTGVGGANGVPRMRGDDPPARKPAIMSVNVFPACAGMIPLMEVPASVVNSVPRMRGDDPTEITASAIGTVCSPHARG